MSGDEVPSHPGRPLSQFLVLLVIGALLPSVLLVGWLIWSVSNLDRERAGQDALRIVRDG